MILFLSLRQFCGPGGRESTAMESLKPRDSVQCMIWNAASKITARTNMNVIEIPTHRLRTSAEYLSPTSEVTHRMFRRNKHGQRINHRCDRVLAVDFRRARAKVDALAALEGVEI